MMTFSELTLAEYIDKLASSEPAPGGGGTASLVGALGLALGRMVGSLTVGKAKYKDVEADIEELNRESYDIIHRFLKLIDEDAEGFLPLAEAYSIPKDDPTREEIMENALAVACQAPMEIMRNCLRASYIIKEYSEKGSVIAISDAGCAAALCEAAIKSASLNILINTQSMKNRDYAETLNDEVNEMLDECEDICEDVFESVRDRFED